jgi:hypothetical protein
MDRFENARDATIAKYRMMQRPQGKLSDGLNLAVDGIATLCMGEPGTASSGRTAADTHGGHLQNLQHPTQGRSVCRHAQPSHQPPTLVAVPRCAGLKDGQAVAEADETMLAAIVSFVFPEASSEEVLTSIRGRPQRVSAYA